MLEFTQPKITVYATIVVIGFCRVMSGFRAPIL